MRESTENPAIITRMVAWRHHGDKPVGSSFDAVNGYLRWLPGRLREERAAGRLSSGLRVLDGHLGSGLSDQGPEEHTIDIGLGLRQILKRTLVDGQPSRAAGFLDNRRMRS
jgi:hypothetical protein